MPLFRRGPLRPQEFFRPLAPFSGTVYLVPDTTALALATFAPTVSTPQLVTPAKASLVLTGFAPTAATPRLITPAKASLVLSGFSPTISTPRLVAPARASLALVGFVPTLTISASVLARPATATLVLTGQIPGVQGDFLHGSSGRVVFDSTWRQPGSTWRQYGQDRYDKQMAILALFQAGGISEEEFAALLAAA